MYVFMIPSRIKNPAFTDVPMIPPMVLKLPHREETAAAVAATTIEVMMTMLERVLVLILSYTDVGR